MKKRRVIRKKDRTDLIIEALDFLRIAVIAVVITLLFFTFVARKKEVVGNSMYPLLEDQESVFINVAAGYLSDIKRFDVVAVKNEDTGELWVKRVIALPNETISYQNGLLYIDGVVVEESFLDEAYQKQVMEEEGLSFFTQDMEPVTLKEDEYFVAGDNRNNSLDSRNANVGPFHRNQIIAKGVLVYSPLSKVRYVSGG